MTSEDLNISFDNDSILLENNINDNDFNINDDNRDNLNMCDSDQKNECLNNFSSDKTSENNKFKK